MPELRQYKEWECANDGYPFAWHGRCICDQLPVVDDAECVYTDCSANGLAIKDEIREQALNRCERCWHPYAKGEGKWSACDDSCRHGGPIRYRWPGAEWNEEVHLGSDWRGALVGAEIEAHYRILTVHHLDEDKANCRWWNLVALCQRCHLRMQRKVVMDRPYNYEHSEWFKPYAAAFYAFKYLGEDLGREEVMARLPDLLRLEHLFTQETLL